MLRLCCLVALLFAFRSSLEAEIVSPTFQNTSQADVRNSPQADSIPPVTKDDESVGWKTILPNIWHDQTKIYWDYPTALGHGHEWIPTVAFVAATGALIAADQYESPFFRRTTTFHGFNSGLSGTNSSLVIAGVPLATYLLGLIKKDKYAQSTAFLMGEAVADSELTAEVLKLVTRRARPGSIQPHGNFGIHGWILLPLPAAAFRPGIPLRHSPLQL